MEIAQYLEETNNMRKIVLNYFTNEENPEEYYQNLINFLDNKNIKGNKYKLKEILHLISKIGDNHQRTKDLFNKIEKILLALHDEILQNFSNFSIFNIFKHNKRIILILLANKLLTIDESIANIMKKGKYKEKNYPIYFFNEIKSFLEKDLRESIQNEIQSINENDSDTFERNRKIGENENYICQLIRNDSIEDFIIYVNKKNLALSSTIEHSIFETNPFLLLNKTDLIEYAAFYGSIQIFKYLYMNNNNLLKPSLLLYAIHGNNPELIHLLERNNLKPENENYEKCLIESIKCHYDDISDYIRNNYSSSQNLNPDVIQKSFVFHNYQYFPKDLTINKYWFEICKYDYINLVEILLKNKDKKSEERTIFFFKMILM